MAGSSARVWFSWNAILKLAVILFVIAIFTVVVTYSTAPYIYSFAGAGIEFKKENSVVVNERDGQSAFTNIPASSGWVDTGVDVPAAATIDIKASGRINLSAGHLIDSTKAHSVPQFAWIGPDGTTYDESASRYLPRRPFLMFNQNSVIGKTPRIGQVLGYLASGKAGLLPPSLEDNPRPDKVFEVNGNRICANKSKDLRRLYLTINDFVLNGTSEAKAAFVGFPQSVIDARSKTFLGDANAVKRNQIWPEIASRHYWRIFYDDNIGEFFITIKVTNNKTDNEPCTA